MGEWADDIPFPTIMANALRRDNANYPIGCLQPFLNERSFLENKKGLDGLIQKFTEYEIKELHAKKVFLELKVRDLKKKIKFLKQDISVKNSVINRLKT